MGLHWRVKLSTVSATLKRRCLTCNRLAESTFEGYGNLAESRLESICFVRVKWRHATSQLCSQLDQKNWDNCE